MTYDHQYVDVYLAETGSRVYKENRSNSKAKGALFGKSTFIKAFEEALLTHKKIVSSVLILSLISTVESIL